MLARLYVWLTPIRMRDLTRPAHEHDWQFSMGCNYCAWYCTGCGRVLYGMDPALPLA